MFFDDILVYNPTIEVHIQRLQHIFELMTEHSLFAKMSKGFFGRSKVEYSGHFISRNGVKTDPQKVAAILNWQPPKNIKLEKVFRYGWLLQKVYPA